MSEDKEVDEEDKLSDRSTPGVGEESEEGPGTGADARGGIVVFVEDGSQAASGAGADGICSGKIARSLEECLVLDGFLFFMSEDGP